MRAVVLFHSGKKSLFSMSEVYLEGFILFIQEEKEDPVKVIIYLEGLPEGPHGFHVHEKGFDNIKNCTTVESCCKQLGGHFTVEPAWGLNNLYGVRHGDHNGDLCFNIFSEDNKVDHQFTTDKISLFAEDVRNVVNRTIVIHQEEDDEGKGQYEDEEKNIESLISGNAGARIACGEIKLIKN